MNKIIIIGDEVTPEPCEYCGSNEELRPYGRNGAKICFACGMKPENLDMTNEAFLKVLCGESELPKPEQSN